MKSLRERFEEKVDRSGDCHEWTGYRLPTGYGRIKVLGRMALAHRVAYELFVGPIPENAHVLHRCDNPGCVNKRHLFLGDHQSNMRDRSLKGRQNRKLSDAEVREIRGRALSGERQRDVAKDFGVSQSLVSVIKTHKVWPHVS